MQSNRRVSVVGAGPVGSMLAVYLARHGFEVEMFERRPDMRRTEISAGRSINLALSVRGLHALRGIGMDQKALSEAIPMRGRMMHSLKGELTFQSYGKDESECIYSMSRGGLNQMLMTAAEATRKVSIHFEHKITEDFLEASKNVVFGTDGSASAIRTAIMEKTRGKHSEVLLNYGYKELQLPAGPGGAHQLEKNALHIWPRGTFMLIALPNFDGSFTCTLFLPFEGPTSFETLTTPEKVRAFFAEQFGDVMPRFPALEDEFFENPTGKMVTVKCSPWHLDGKALLLGDAAHAIVPFFGQGLNCGFEDCTVLDELMSRQTKTGATDWEKVFTEFNSTRKPNADAIADLAEENFIEMRDKVGDPRFLLQKQVEKVLEKEFPGRFIPRYGMVTFSRVPYRQALEAGRIHAEILGKLCHGISDASQIDLQLAKKLISSKLEP